ncbi:MAG: AAA family ATPase [Chitinophagales bacterium]|nr:AAA family ATPase [Chitinophagales bacterium]
MDFNKFTIKTQELFAAAQGIAQNNQNQAIEVSHFIEAILLDEENTALQLIKKTGASSQILLNQIQEINHKMPKIASGEFGKYLSNEFSQIISKAMTSMSKFQDAYLTPELILLELLRGNFEISKLLKNSGLKLEDYETALAQTRIKSKVTDNSSNQSFDNLEKYAINLNLLAEQGKLDPVIGRDEEIRRVLHILSRKTKNNPILIGAPGVGKTAIAEGIARRIINQDVPDNIKDIRVFSLDMSALIAGAKFKGEFEERLKMVVKEVIDSEGKIVLFIDEIHTLIGAGKSDGAMDAANILKPSLARGELRVIGATTLDEYQKYFEKDKAMERRFQKVTIDEPNEEDAISILRGLKERYERYHNVAIKDEAIIGAVQLSQRYITDRFLPDKAIDLIDEAASKLRLEINSMPEELDELNRKIMQLEIEREAIRRENDASTLAHIEQQNQDLQDKKNIFELKWKQEKELVDEIQAAKNQIEGFKVQAEQAERQGDFARVAEIRYGQINDLTQKIESLNTKLEEISDKIITDEVQYKDIAEIVSKWTGIPVKSMLQSEREKLLDLENILNTQVIGQPKATKAVANAILRSKAGLQNPNRPLGSFLFIGSTGVGKTELAKVLAEYLFQDKEAYIRIDMSEFQEKHSISRLVGAPPGYVGYEESGQLSEAVRRKPYSVVLLDEIEKAHPDIFNVLLQVLDDGRLTDNKGRLVNFKNTIIIMTSNIGSDIIYSEFDQVAEKDYELVAQGVQHKLVEMLKQQVRPEFINRIDDIVLFQPLGKTAITSIIRLQLEDVNKQLANHQIVATFGESLVDFLIDYGFDREFGARPIKRLIQNEVVNELAKRFIAGELKPNSNIHLEYRERLHIEIRK